jgi:alpha-tubulin suppressor-like RCC1 family protein
MAKKHLQIILVLIFFFGMVSSSSVGYARLGSGAVGALMESVLDSAVDNRFFERYIIEAEVIGQGEVIKEPNLQTYPHKKLVKLQAIPAEGWNFSHWDGGIIGSDNPACFLVEKNINITAVFKQNEYILSITPTGEGSTIIDPSKEIYHYGDQITVTTTANSGWRFDHWEGFINGNENPSTFTITQNTNINAVFREKFIAIASRGEKYSLALKEDGTVWAWGGNNFGQLGNGTINNTLTPIQVSNLNNVIAMTGGSGHSLALKEDGTVWAWGYNNYGQLGDGTTNNSLTPVQVNNLNKVVAIASGIGGCSLAIREDGTVWAWGYNNYGQLGDGTTNNSLTPVQVNNLNNVVAITGGRDHSLALKEDGTVWAWGRNFSGQLDDGITNDSLIPVQVINLSNIVAITSGFGHSLALKEDGTVWAWGDNNYGELGDGTINSTFTPVQVSNLNNVVAISGGAGHSLALKEDGTVWAWGFNLYGQLGNGTTDSSLTPIQVSNLSNIVDIISGTEHSLALKEDGSIWAWGDNLCGQLGYETTNFFECSYIPMQISRDR